MNYYCEIELLFLFFVIVNGGICFIHQEKVQSKYYETI